MPEVVDRALAPLVELPAVRDVARAARPQREVPPERPGLGPDLGDERRSEHAVRDVVLEPDVAVVVDVPPARAAVDDALADDARRTPGVGPGPVEVARVPGLRVRVSVLRRDAVRRVRHGPGLVGPAEPLERDAPQPDVAVHEHHVAASLRPVVLGAEPDAPRQVRDVRRQVLARRDVVVLEGFLDPDGRPLDARERQPFVLVAVRRQPREHEAIAGPPARRLLGENE